jgi:hypothetical protein
MSGQPGIVVLYCGARLAQVVMRYGGSWRDHRTELAVQQKNRTETWGHGLAQRSDPDKDIHIYFVVVFRVGICPFFHFEKLNF